MEIDVYKVIGDVMKRNGVEWKDGMKLQHIKYDPKVNDDYDYKIIRNSAHDGTFLFTMELMEKAVIPLINRTTYYKLAIPNEKEHDRTRFSYTVGDGVIKREFRDIKIGDGMYPGQDETIEIPVKFHYV